MPAAYSTVQLTMSMESGAPVCRYTIKYATGDVASGIADRTQAMQFVNQFYPTEINLLQQAINSAGATTPATPFTTTATQSVSGSVAVPGATVKVGL